MLKAISYIIIFCITVSSNSSASETNDYQAIAKEIVKEFGLVRMTLSIDNNLVATQSRKDQLISFEHAMQRALDSYINDSKDIESPLAIALNYYSQNNNSSNLDSETILNNAIEILVDEMNKKTTTFKIASQDEAEEFGYEENLVNNNWVFILHIESLSDHLYYAIVSRNNGETYNYGFN